MSDIINIPIPAAIFARLQHLAVPLVDDTISVIEKLIDHWEANHRITNLAFGQARRTEPKFGGRYAAIFYPLVPSCKRNILGKPFAQRWKRKGFVSMANFMTVRPLPEFLRRGNLVEVAALQVQMGEHSGKFKTPTQDGGFQSPLSARLKALTLTHYWPG